MSEHYKALLNVTVEHLQTLKANGCRFVEIQPETLQALVSPLTARVTQQLEPSASAALIPPAFTHDQPIAAPTAAGAIPMPAAQSPDMPKTKSPVSDRATSMEELRGRVQACTNCPHLVRSRKNVVFGVGDIHSPLLFVGEAPGADEDAQGEPFVGMAGQLLTKIIVAMGFTRETVYIANILKCRPDTPGQTSGNRKPTVDEMKTCLPFLLAQIDQIKPKVIVALGATAIEGLLGKTEGITKLRGKFQNYQGIPLMPTYHPAYLLRNQAMSEKRKVWEDMLQVLEKLGAPITEKQRGYFLKQ